MGKTLLEHAAYELTKAKLTNNPDPEARKAATDIMALVRRFVKQDHNQTTAPIVLDLFNELCNFMPIAEITDDPAEWEEFSIETTNKETGKKNTVSRWQSKRCPWLSSEDAGKTWVDAKTGKSSASIDHIKEEARLDDERKNTERIAKAAEAKATEKEASDGTSEELVKGVQPDGQETAAQSETATEAPDTAHEADAAKDESPKA